MSHLFYFFLLQLLLRVVLVHIEIAWTHSARTQPAFDGRDNYLCLWPYLDSPRPLQSCPLYRDYPSKYLFCFPQLLYCISNHFLQPRHLVFIGSLLSSEFPGGFSLSNSKISPSNFGPCFFIRIKYHGVYL